MGRFVTLALCLVFACIASPAIAQDAVPDPEPLVAIDEWPNALGAGYTSALGFSGGLSYQRWLGSFGFSITGGLLANPSAGLTLDYAAILGLQWRVYAEDFSRWFSGCLYLSGLAGIHSTQADSGDTFLIGGGGGIGMELVFARHFSQMTEFLYIGDNTGLITFGVVQTLRYRF